MASRKPTTRPAPDLLAGGSTRVALYLRISTDEDHQPFSLSAQEHRLTAFVASQPGWEHIKTYTDQFSGAYSWILRSLGAVVPLRLSQCSAEG